jgi:hypothetical protein
MRSDCNGVQSLQDYRCPTNRISAHPSPRSTGGARDRCRDRRGQKPINLQPGANFRSGAHYGLKSDIARSPLCARSGREHLQQSRTNTSWNWPHDHRASTRAVHHLALASGLTTARVVLMNSSASGLSVRFFKVINAIVPRALFNSTGNALSEGCLRGSINV